MTRLFNLDFQLLHDTILMAISVFVLFTVMSYNLFEPVRKMLKGRQEKIKTELENLSFRYEHPEEYREIEKKLEATAVERDKVFKEFTAPIRAQLDKMGLKYRILARIKSIYSIWNKMQTKHVPFEEIYDLLAVRIIFEPRNMEDCLLYTSPSPRDTR